MEFRFEESFLADTVALEAQDRGLESRLAELVELRVADGMLETDAAADAAETIGLASLVREHLSAPFADLVEPEVEAILFRNAHGGMPEWRRDGTAAEVAISPARLSELMPVLGQLRAAVAAEPERMTVVVPVGLGGTGGCACGDELPEDAPPGPLFERRI